MMTVRTTSIDIARHNGRRADVPINQATDVADDVTDSDRTLAYQQVRAIIDNNLSNNQRLIIDMREMQGLEFDEIAMRMNMTAVNVRVELSRARKRVREIYRNKKRGS